MKPNLVTRWLAEPVLYGGQPMTRGEMIDQLWAAAREQTPDRARQRRMVDMYLAGHRRSAANHPS